MADNTVIAATLQVGTGTSNTNIKEVKKNLDDVKGSLKDTGSAATATGKAVEGAGGNFSNLKDQMKALPGPLGSATSGVNTLSSSFKALLANPVVLIITLIVGALALLYKAFTNTFAGGQKVEEIFAGLKAAGQALFDNLEKIAGALVKLFTFDFSGAISDIKEVVSSAADAYTAMASLTQQAQKLHQEQLKNDLEQAERAKKLAILREQSTDESIPLAKRKAALKELQKDAEENAKQDVELAKKITDNQIAQYTLQKDGALKNQDEINQLKIQQIEVETTNANELRRINKQVTAAEKQEAAERKAQNAATAEAQKAEREKLAAFNLQLSKLQNENVLSSIKDAYEKELKALEIKISSEKSVNEKALAEKKLTKAQFDQLTAALDIQANLQRDAIIDKHNLELAKKEEDFQKELVAISNKTRIAGIVDGRELEKVQLEIGYEEKLQDAITRYKDDAVRFQEVKNALDQQLKVEQEKIDEKNRVEDEKKKLELAEKTGADILSDPEAAFDAKKAALDAEQQAVQEAFDAKVITEIQYNEKLAGLSDARKTLREQERDHSNMVAGAVADGLNTLAEIAGKQTALGKTLAIASTTIKTFQGAIAAFTGMTTSIPGPVGIALGIVAAAGAVAAGIAAVKKIVAVNIPGQGSGGTVPSAPPQMAAPVAPTQASTKIDQGSVSDFGKAVNQTPLQAYVIESQGAAAVARAKRLEGASVLGG